MNSEFITDLIVNASLLLSISIIYNAFFLSKTRKNLASDIILGLLLGLIGVTLIMNAVVASTGVIFDTRSILVSAGGLFFGAIPTGIAVVIICIYRVFRGGPGQLTGVLVTILAGCTGLIWRYFRFKKISAKKKNTWTEFYLLGLTVHVIMLACMLALPRERILQTLKEITLPVLLFYPIAEVILCVVIFYVQKNMRTEIELKRSELQFRTIFEQAPIGIAISDKRDVLQYNERYLKILGRTKEEVIETGWENFTHPDDLKEDLEKLALLKSGKIRDYTMVKRYLKPDRSIVWVNMTALFLTLNNNPFDTYLCMVQDITQMKEAEIGLKESETNYKNLYHEYQDKQIFLQSLLNSMPDLIFYKNIDGKYIGCNQSFAELVGRDTDSIIGHTDYDFFEREQAEFFREMDRTMLAQCDERMNEENVTYPDGIKICLETLKTPYYDSNGKVSGLIGVSRDITERKNREEEILYLNYHDVLTGLYNRAFFDNEKNRLDVADSLPFSVIIGDINGLKFVNDAFGHEQGDILLIEIAKILTSCCGKNEIIARTGGDEFCILLPRTDEKKTNHIVESIKQACIDYADQKDKETYYTSISLGYAAKTNVDESLTDVIRLAEEYMYRHKLLEHKSLHSAIISSIKITMYEKSNETEEHAERMAEMAKKLGRALSLKEDDLVSLELVSTLHDIGKISIDQRILNKPGPLTEDEWVQIKKHPDVGYRIALTVPELSRVAEYILCHHERWDGKGYPQGLVGDEIPVISRVLTLVDSYDAMTQDRFYKKAMSKEDAILEIRKNAGTQFDPELSEIFIESILSEDE